jgi:two-component system, cell cycle sensor histidine kinase and response regulator CckA
MPTPLQVLIILKSEADISHFKGELLNVDAALEIATTTSVGRALQIENSGAWDIIITDQNLSAYEVKAALILFRSHNPDLIFIHTGENLDENEAAGAVTDGVLFVPRTRTKMLAPLIRRQLRKRDELRRLRELETKMLHAPRLEALGRLAGGVAHDFNNVLATVLICSEEILDHLPPDTLVHENLKLILNSAQKGAALTRQLLAFTRNQISEPQILNVNGVLENMAKMLRRLIGEDIEFELVLDPTLGNTQMDPCQIEQIIMNLVVNSRDAMPEGGKLKIVTGNAQLSDEKSDFFDIKPGPYVMFSVTDSGCGMDAGTISKMFEPFFTTKTGIGTGLGLSTVYGIVTQNQGCVFVESKPGKGTTFKVYFPLSDKSVGPLRSSEDTPLNRSAAQAYNILLVEDDDELRTVMSSWLEKKGYHVQSTNCCERAIQIATDKSQRIDLLFTDIVMPKMIGTDMAKQILLFRSEIKILFMSGYIDFSEGDFESIQKHAAFIQKPFSTRDLLGKLTEIQGLE